MNTQNNGGGNGSSAGSGSSGDAGVGNVGEQSAAGDSAAGAGNNSGGDTGSSADQKEGQVQNGGTSDNAGSVDWRSALAGGNESYLETLKQYETPDQLLARLNVDWRKQMAGEDQDALKFLEKYSDPSAAYKAWRSAVSKISEGGKVKLPSADAKPEEISEYAKAIGVAEAVDKYEITAAPKESAEDLKKMGIDFGDEQTKEALGAITAGVHEALSSGKFKANDIINVAHQIYYDMNVNAAKQAAEKAIQISLQSEIENRAIWGDDQYDANLKRSLDALRHFFPGNDENAFQQFISTPLASGECLFDNAVVQRMFAQIGAMVSEDPHFNAGSTDSSFDPQKRLDEIKQMRNGTKQQRDEYAKLTAPGGEYGRLLQAIQYRNGGKAA